MKNTNSKEYKQSVKAYLAPIITEALKERGQPIDGNIYLSILGVAKSECKEYFNKLGYQQGMTHWLAGLGMGIDYTNYDICKLEEAWHGCKLTDKQAETVINNWFSHIALKIIQFSRVG